MVTQQNTQNQDIKKKTTQTKLNEQTQRNKQALLDKQNLNRPSKAKDISRSNHSHYLNKAFLRIKKMIHYKIYWNYGL